MVAKTKADVKVVSSATVEIFSLKLRNNKEKKNYQAAHGISLFLVDSNLAGFHKGSKLKKLGLKGQVLHVKDLICSPNQLLKQPDHLNKVVCTHNEITPSTQYLHLARTQLSYFLKTSESQTPPCLGRKTMASTTSWINSPRRGLVLIQIVLHENPMCCIVFSVTRRYRSDLCF